MATPAIVQTALDQLENSEFKPDFKEGSNEAKGLFPKHIRELYELAKQIEWDEYVAENGNAYIIVE